MQDELEALTNVLQTPVRPLAAIVGGAKVSTKLDLLGSLLAKVDTLVIGGGMANTFLAACGHSVGKSLCERDLLPTAREIAVAGVGNDEMILDIGPRSIERVCSVLARVKTLVWNGPFGAFELEPFDIGTVEVAEAAAELTAAGKIVSVAGGGDTVEARPSSLPMSRPPDIGGLSTFSSRWMVGHEERRARKPATVRRRLSSNIKKDYPILQIAVYGGIEGVNKIIEPLHEPFTRVRCYARQMSGANQLALRPR